MNKGKCDFTFSHYADMLKQAKEKGYKLSSFRDFDSSAEKAIILRHDVDETVKSILSFAKAEKAIGATATYFLRIHNYNVLEPGNYKAISKVINLNHEIGIHFEPQSKIVFGCNEKESFLKAKSILETVFGIEIVSASKHGSAKQSDDEKNYETMLEGVPKEQVGIKNYSYEPRFFKEIKYISESSKYWREGCLCKHIGIESKIQVLTHPVWWC